MQSLKDRISRLTKWEFWPFWFFYIPVGFYFIWLSIRSRSFFFFSASNPSMDFGGMIGEKKSEIFKTIPSEFYPKTALIDVDETPKAEELGFSFPCIAKPDIGERGHGVELMHSQKELDQYSNRMKVPFLLQEFVEYPVELGVFYIREPDSSKGLVTSIVQKDFLSVVGDGKLSVEELLDGNLRARLQVDKDHERVKFLLDQIPKKGEVVVIEHIGNHCRGTKFLDVTFEIDQRLTDAIDRLAHQIDGFYYGRFDLKCKSIEQLKELKDFTIVELNGAGAEPGHIYQPGFSLWEAYKIVFWHFKLMGKICRANHKRGVSYWSFRDGIKKLLDIRAYNRLLMSV